MKILVTGSEGFIASHVVKRLLALGHNVVGVDILDPQVHGGGPTRRPDSTYTTHPNYDFRMFEVGFMPYYEDFDTVIHLAAQVGVGQSMYEPARYTWGNSHQTGMLLEKMAKRKPKRLVVASSMSVYGEGPHWLNYEGQHIAAPAHEDLAPDLRSIYALTKYDQEQLSLIWGKAQGVETVALRFFNCFGEGQSLTNPYTGALAIFATRLLNGKSPMIYDDGQQTRDFIHVDDVSDAVIHAALNGIAPGVYNVGTGVATTLENAACYLGEALKAPIGPTITGKVRAGDIRHCYADTQKINATGWKAKVEFRDGIERYAAWLKQQPLPTDRFDDAAAELVKAGLVK